MVAMAENMLDLPADVGPAKGIKLVYMVFDPDQDLGEDKDWMHIPGLDPPICSVPILCVAPVFGLPLHVHAYDPRTPPGPSYFAVGRGCCDADRHNPGFWCDRTNNPPRPEEFKLEVTTTTTPADDAPP